LAFTWVYSYAAIVRVFMLLRRIEGSGPSTTPRKVNST